MNNINVLVINLKNRKQRRKNVLKELKKVFNIKQIKVFEAVNKEKAKEIVEEISKKLLANMVIEDYSISIK